MFSNLIRDFQIARNHRRRVNSIVLRSNDEIVRRMDQVKAKFLEAQRLEKKEETIRYQAMKDVYEWLITDEAK